MVISSIVSTIVTMSISMSMPMSCSLSEIARTIAIQTLARGSRVGRGQGKEDDQQNSLNINNHY